MPDTQTTSTRLRSEQHFHDVQARQRALHLHGTRLCFADDAYLDHASWLRPALAKLGPLQGRRVLDLGCGHGMAAVVLARAGSEVTGLDLSEGYLAEARQRAEANGVSIRWVQADAERLPFADEAFDCVWGNAILHHLEVAAAGAELRRILKPHGVAVFCEPWGENPVLRWGRAWFPYPEKQRTPDEQPLTPAAVATLRQFFPGLHVEGHELLGMAARLAGPGRTFPLLGHWDRMLLRRWPALARWCRYVVLHLRKTT